MASRGKPQDEAPSAHSADHATSEQRSVAATMAEYQSAQRHPGDDASLADAADPGTASAPVSAFALLAGQFTWAADPRGYLTERIAWTIYTGQTLEQSAGEGWLDAVHPDDRSPTRESWLAAVATRSTRYEATFRVRRADGNYAPVLLRAVPMRDASNHVTGWIGACAEPPATAEPPTGPAVSQETPVVLHTHAQLDEAQAARRLAEERAAFLSVTLESLSDGLVITDAEGRVLFGNAAYTALLGVEVEDNGLSDHVPSRITALNARNADGKTLREQEWPLRGHCAVRQLATRTRWMCGFGDSTGRTLS